MSIEWDIADPEFRMLVVCTGNICRSPLAERLLQAGFDELAPRQFRIASAGTQAREGEPVTDQTRAIAEGRGLSITDFTSSRLAPQHIEAADLILTMERAQRSEVVQMVPEALRRTFTLREFARILPLIPPEGRTQSAQRWHSLAALARRYRRPAPDPADSDDIVDPFGGSDAVYATMVEQLVPAIHSLIGWEHRFSPKAT